MGGLGNDAGNLIPTTHLTNHDILWRDFEEYMKNDSKNEDLSFYAKVEGYYPPPFPDGFPTGLHAELKTASGALINVYDNKIAPPCSYLDALMFHPPLNKKESKMLELQACCGRKLSINELSFFIRFCGLSLTRSQKRNPVEREIFLTHHWDRIFPYAMHLPSILADQKATSTRLQNS